MEANDFSSWLYGYAGVRTDTKAKFDAGDMERSYNAGGRCEHERKTKVFSDADALMLGTVMELEEGLEKARSGDNADTWNAIPVTSHSADHAALQAIAGRRKRWWDRIRNREIVGIMVDDVSGWVVGNKEGSVPLNEFSHWREPAERPKS